nr:MAG TPA: hypothetical protein [Caudoviricetes sp.]
MTRPTAKGCNPETVESIPPTLPGHRPTWTIGGCHKRLRCSGRLLHPCGCSRKGPRKP